MRANHARAMLNERAKRWPDNYVQRCWPELLDGSTCRLLRRRKFQHIYAEAPDRTKTVSCQSRHISANYHYISALTHALVVGLAVTVELQSLQVNCVGTELSIIVGLRDQRRAVMKTFRCCLLVLDE